MRVGVVLLVSVYVKLRTFRGFQSPSLPVIMAEFVNTMVEAIVDLIVGEQYHPLAKVAKDVASGAVLAAVAFAIVI